MAVDLEKMKGIELPDNEWDITDVLDDIIMVQFVDVPEDGDGDYIMRRGIVVKTDPAKMLWRVGKVIIHGPKCSKQIKKGTYILMPNDRGIHVPQIGEFKHVAFINEERIFGLCKPRINIGSDRPGDSTNSGVAGHVGGSTK